MYQKIDRTSKTEIIYKTKLCILIGSSWIHCRRLILGGGGGGGGI